MSEGTEQARHWLWNLCCCSFTLSLQVRERPEPESGSLVCSLPAAICPVTASSLEPAPPRSVAPEGSQACKPDNTKHAFLMT